MDPRPRRYIRDIVETASLMQESTGGKTLADYQADIRLRHQIERELTIIGEAIARLAQVDRSVAIQVSDYDGYIGLRNVLNHQYPDIDHATIWRTIEFEISILIQGIKSLLAEN